MTPEQRKLLCDIRREFPSASASLILRTLVADGRLESDAVSATTVRRLFMEAGLDRLSQRASDGGKMRMRWQAESPGALWHGDVCHGPALLIEGKPKLLRIHALMDDASRYVVVLEYVDIGQKAAEAAYGERRLVSLHREAKAKGFALVPLTSAFPTG